MAPRTFTASEQVRRYRMAPRAMAGCRRRRERLDQDGLDLPRRRIRQNTYLKTQAQRLPYIAQFRSLLWSEKLIRKPFAGPQSKTENAAKLLSNHADPMARPVPLCNHPKALFQHSLEAVHYSRARNRTKHARILVLGRYID